MPPRNMKRGNRLWWCFRYPWYIDQAPMAKARKIMKYSNARFSIISIPKMGKLVNNKGKTAQ